MTTKEELELEQVKRNCLIELAKSKGQYIYCSYQNLWWTPDQLAEENANGRFRWGIMNFKLRPISDYIAMQERELRLAQEKMDRIENDLWRTRKTDGAPWEHTGKDFGE